MKNSFVLSAVVAAGLMAGVVMAPAQAEEDLREIGPCVDFSTEFGPTNNSNLSDVKVDGAAWSATLVAAPTSLEVPYEVDLPYLRIFNTKHDPGCPYSYGVPITFDWVKPPPDWSVDIVRGIETYSNEYGQGMSMRNSDVQDAWFKIKPTTEIAGYGTYTFINDVTMNYLYGDQGPEEKTTQVSYTLTVVPPTEAGNQLPEVPNEPAGISDGYDFGNVEIFDYKRGVVEITNIGEQDLAVRKANIVDSNGDEAPEFSVTGTNCKDGFIAPMRSCEVQVQFFPRVEGSRAAFIEVVTNGDYLLQIPLTGVGTYTKPESVVEAEKEAEAGGTEPVYEVAEPEKVVVPDVKGQEVTKKNGKSVVKAKKKKIKVKWKAPDTDQPVTGYEIRSKFKKKSWKKWKDVDPMPNKKGWIKASVKAKKSGNYKIQVTSSTPWVERGDKATVKIKKK